MSFVPNYYCHGIICARERLAMCYENFEFDMANLISKVTDGCKLSKGNFVTLDRGICSVKSDKNLYLNKTLFCSVFVLFWLCECNYVN